MKPPAIGYRKVQDLFYAWPEPDFLDLLDEALLTASNPAIAKRKIWDGDYSNPADRFYALDVLSQHKATIRKD